MARLDDRLHEDLERAARPGDPSGLYEDLIRRRERRRARRRVQGGVLVALVLVGTVAGFYGLTRAFRTSEPRIGDGSVVENGVIGMSLYQRGTGASPEHHLFAIEPEGTGLVQLTAGEAMDTALAWSPDGSQVAFWRARHEGAGIWVADADGADPKLVLPTDLSIGAIGWSPDGSQLAFIGIDIVGFSGPDAEMPSDLFTMGADGGHLTKVDEQGPITDFDWSPTGDRFVVERLFDLGNGATGTDLSVMDATGGNEIPLTADGVSSDPTWSPDGSTIVFVQTDHDRFQKDLYAISPDGSSPRRLTRDGLLVEDPVWAPDGAQIAFARLRQGDADQRCELVVMSADGSSARTIADGVDLGGCPVDLDWQPILVDAASVDPIPTEPSDTPSPVPAEARDIGLGYVLCDVDTVRGPFVPGGSQTAIVGTVLVDGACPQGQEVVFGVVALDVDGDGLADVATGVLECRTHCTPFATPDIDGDETQELLIQNVEFSIAGLLLIDFGDPPGPTNLLASAAVVAFPADPEHGFESDVPPQLWLGGDAFELDALTCEDRPDGRVLIVSQATEDPPDSVDAVWKVQETVFRLASAGVLEVVSSRDYQEPIDPGPDGPSFASDETLCGANLGP